MDSPTQDTLESTRALQHACCLFCGTNNPIGFKLDFQARDDGSVYTSYPCSKLLQSYPGMVHGGMVAALLDAAMTNCLFSRGVTAVTGDLRVRFRQPVKVDCVAEITAAVVRTRGRLRHLTAELLQDGKPMARATATFVVRRPAHAQDRAGNAPDHRESGLPSDAAE